MKKLIFLLAIAAMLAPPLWGQGEPNKEIWVKDLMPARIYVCKFMPDDNFIINGADNMIQIRRAEDGEIVNEIDFGGPISDIDFSPDGTQFSACGDFLKVYDTETLELIRSIEMPYSEFPDNRYHGVSGLSYTVDGSGLIGTAQNFEMKSVTKIVVWNTQNGEIIKEFGDSTQHYWDYVECSPDGKYIAVAMVHYPYSIYLYDADTYELLHIFYNQCLKGGGILDLRFSSDSKYLASTNPMPYTLRIWDVLSKELIVEESQFYDESLTVYSFDFTNDNDYLIIGGGSTSQDIGNMVYKIKDQSIIYKYSPITSAVNSLYLNSDNTRILGTTSRSISLVDLNISILSTEEKSKITDERIIPNPVENELLLNFSLPHSGSTLIELFDETGISINRIFDGYLESGENEILIPMQDIIPGMYMIRITQNDYVKVVKLIKE